MDSTIVLNADIKGRFIYFKEDIQSNRWNFDISNDRIDFDL